MDSPIKGHNVSQFHAYLRGIVHQKGDDNRFYKGIAAHSADSDDVVINNDLLGMSDAPALVGHSSISSSSSSSFSACTHTHSVQTHTNARIEELLRINRQLQSSLASQKREIVGLKRENQRLRVSQVQAAKLERQLKTSQKQLKSLEVKAGLNYSNAGGFLARRVEKLSSQVKTKQDTIARLTRKLDKEGRLGLADTCLSDDNDNRSPLIASSSASDNSNSVPKRVMPMAPTENKRKQTVRRIEGPTKLSNNDKQTVLEYKTPHDSYTLASLRDVLEEL
jgi:hypothetical protein